MQVVQIHILRLQQPQLRLKQRQNAARPSVLLIGELGRDEDVGAVGDQAVLDGFAYRPPDAFLVAVGLCAV